MRDWKSLAHVKWECKYYVHLFLWVHVCNKMTLSRSGRRSAARRQ